ncbi:MAG: HDOD domain-containing protein [Betaproteobacteria bacterium]
MDNINLELPAKPDILAKLTAQMGNDEADFREVSDLIVSDIGLAAAVVKTANAPYFGVRARITSIQQAVNYLGLTAVFGLVLGSLLRRSFPANDPLMAQLWDDSARNAAAMSRLALGLALGSADQAYTCGLFLNCGSALMLPHTEGYRGTFAHIRHMANPLPFELDAHGINHSDLGEALVRKWGLPDTVAQTVKHHHSVARLAQLGLNPQANSLIAASVIAASALADIAADDKSDWDNELSLAGEVLGLAPAAVQGWVDKLTASFCAEA